MQVKRTLKLREPAYVVAPPACCLGYGCLELADMDYEPYGKVACWCPAGKAWAASKIAA
ncbi:hypothetical protein ACWEJ6_49505 [Nonomuraea sp. NPDC004702]